MKKFMFSLLLGIIASSCHAQDHQLDSKDALKEKNGDGLMIDQRI